MHVNAIIVAAGKGERMGASLPKVFLPLAGMPLLIHTLRNVGRSPIIAKLVLVIASEREALCRELLATYGSFGSPVTLVHGGPARQDSVRFGLAALDQECDIVVIHDAARPFVSAELIHRSVTVAAMVGGALVAVPVRDTIKRVTEAGTVVETVSRHDLWLAQTPQTFRVPLIRDAHAHALRKGIQVTDDVTLVEHMGGKVQVVPGGIYNFKITTPEDLQLAEAMLGAGTAPRAI
jgi:2-C-methyl-D-erythritol 4-phosphate cytidylyltransferase